MALHDIGASRLSLEHVARRLRVEPPDRSMLPSLDPGKLMRHCSSLFCIVRHPMLSVCNLLQKPDPEASCGWEQWHGSRGWNSLRSLDVAEAPAFEVN